MSNWVTRYSIEKDFKIKKLTEGLKETYSETCFINYLNIDVFIIDIHNQITKMIRSDYTQVRKVELYYTKSEGIRQVNVSNLNPENINYFKITINKEDLENAPIFVKELNIVLCLLKDINKTKHPYSIESKELYFEELKQDLQSRMEYPPVNVLVNDPSGKIKFIYFNLNDHLTKIDVKQDFTEEAYIKIKFNTANGEMVYDVDFEEIDKNRGKIIRGEHEFYIHPSKQIIEDSIYTNQMNKKYFENNDTVGNVVKRETDLLNQKIKQLTETVNLLKTEIQNGKLRHQNELDEKERSFQHELRSIKNKENFIILLQEQIKELTNKLDRYKKEEEDRLRKEEQQKKYQHDEIKMNIEKELYMKKIENESKNNKTNIILNMIKLGIVIIPLLSAGAIYLNKKNK